MKTYSNKQGQFVIEYDDGDIQVFSQSAFASQVKVEEVRNGKTVSVSLTHFPSVAAVQLWNSQIALINDDGSEELEGFPTLKKRIVLG